MKVIKIISRNWFLAARTSWIAVSSVTGDTRLMKGCCWQTSEIGGDYSTYPKKPPGFFPHSSVPFPHAPHSLSVQAPEHCPLWSFLPPFLSESVHDSGHYKSWSEGTSSPSTANPLLELPLPHGSKEYPKVTWEWWHRLWSFEWKMSPIG